MLNLQQKRILIVDDNPDIHEDFKTILKASPKKNNPIQKILFGHNETNNFKSISFPNLKVDSAYQGKEAAELVHKALNENHPYALAFVDIRMPPGWDGIETIKEIWKIDSELQVVICTAYSDYSWQEMFGKLNGSENFLILKKPFDIVEVRQLAVSLSKKWEYKRRIKNKIENLETIVSERTKGLREALEIAQDANQIKNEFLSNVSSELRTPLNGIIGFTELIYQGKVDQANIKEYCHDILSSSKFLLQMIEDIVDMSMLESEKIIFNPESIKIGLLMDEIKEIFDNKLGDKKIKFNFIPDLNLREIVSDSKKIKQVLQHFISNAIKFTPVDGEIVARIIPLQDNQFKIEVTDTGIGIHEKDIKKIFTPFQQLDASMSKKYGGIGLGLALTRRIVESQGGKVGVTSNPGKGSTFYAILPSLQKT